MKALLVTAITSTLAACGQPSDEPDVTAQSSSPGIARSAETATVGEPCSLIIDTNSMFGPSVSASESTAGETKSCTWKSEDGRVCGSVTVFGPNWNEVSDVKANYSAITRSLGAFGRTLEVAELGEEAREVDGGMLGAQVAFRTSKVAALVAASSCSPESPDRMTLARKLAREIAGRL
jgi:hypothetical protein